MPAVDCDLCFQSCSEGGGSARGYSDSGKARGNPVLQILLLGRDMGKSPSFVSLYVSVGPWVPHSYIFFFFFILCIAQKTIHPANETEQRDSLFQCQVKLLLNLVLGQWMGNLPFSQHMNRDMNVSSEHKGLLSSTFRLLVYGRHDYPVCTLFWICISIINY